MQTVIHTRRGSEAAVTLQSFIDKEAKFLRNQARADFADQLAIARMVWRAHPDLVEAKRFPESLRIASLEYNDCEPETFSLKDDIFRPHFERKIARRAAKNAQARFLQSRAKTLVRVTDGQEGRARA